MKPYQYTKYLVIFSLFMSVCSFVANKLYDTKELYPFYWWQLFHYAPRLDASFTVYRVYEITPKNDTIRLLNDGTGIDNILYNNLCSVAANKFADENVSIDDYEKRVQAIGLGKTKHETSRFILVEENYPEAGKIDNQNINFQKKILKKDATN